ncbi:hypothetical protein CHS0354_006787 [Potamilus streckersoni]|uniref:Uncharacterized protein n=1 Tax=Potamilus streckersoni TaxID=2493646 RepID=A0AAE0VRB7_9BIVA|nr:hypothetical protein CHS0354_006787 [Potamilus streckersoni]
MKLQLWLKVQSQWNSLVQSLNVSRVSDILMEKLVFMVDDLERIKHEVTINDKSRKLLEILKYKDDKHFKNFLIALKESDHVPIAEAIEDYKGPDEIHEELGNTTKEAEKIIKQCLEENFEKNPVGKVCFSEIMDQVRHSFRAQGECFEHDEIMTKLVTTVMKDVFSSSHMEASTRKSMDCVSGIQMKEIQEAKDTDMTTAIGKAMEQAKEGESFGSNRLVAQSKTSQELRMSDMTEDQLCEWLTPVLKRNNIDAEEFLQTIKDNEINGKAFENMTPEEMECHFSFIKFGKRKVILVDRDEYLAEMKAKEVIHQKALRSEPESIINIPREVFREFNTTSKAVNIYRQGAVMPEIETRVVDRIQPVHRFMHTEAIISEENQIKVIVDAVIEFAAACMNERTNGTIHFGISGNANDKKSYGKVIGIPAKNPHKYDEALVKAIESKFYPDQKDKALACIRPPQFVRVLQKQQNEELFVIEVDIVPNVHIVGNEAFFIKDNDQDRAILYRYLTNAPKELNQKEVEVYMKDKIILSDDRRNGEKTFHKGPKNIRRELQWFLCNGSEQMDGDIYPLIFLSPPETTGCIEDFQFLNYLDSSAVFDFDPKGTDGEIYRVVKDKQYTVKTTDDFDAEFVKQKSILENFSDLKKPLNQPWFFCNGHESAGKKEMDSFKWTQERSEIFKKLLSFYQEQIPHDRARIIFIIHSKHFEVLAEAAREVVLKFKGKWIMLSDSINVAESWKAFLLGHYNTCFEKQTLDERCFAGMPWRTVRDTIKDFVHTEHDGQCEIPTIYGGFVEVPIDLKKELCDLEILGARECDNQEAMIENSDDHRKKVEEDFYRGYQVSWWNFWYNGQVLRRNEQDNIFKHILEVSRGDLPHDEKVGFVAIYHQPGSGGTTAARQALWDNRHTYPCLVVKQITNLTCSQICKIRSHPTEENIQVPVILIDNEDDEKLLSLKESLEEEAKKCTQRVFCVLLVCYRRTILPFENIHKYISLKQKMDKQEQNWFQQKYKDLMKRYEQNKGVNPNHLISLNIMKENFNSECISRTVKEFLRGLNTNEPCLLKYIALVNAYDPNFSPIPVSCFDPIMTRKEYVPSSNRQYRTIGEGWEQRLGQALLVLLSRIEQGQLGRQAKFLRVTNPLLSKEIMKQMLRNDDQTLGEAFLEFLSCPLFHCSNAGSNTLLRILQTVMKKREWVVHGKEAWLESFSPLLQSLIDSGDTSDAIKILKVVFDYTNDPMIAQQIARLFNVLEAWEEADHYAGIACKLRPKDSFLKHTQGQICKSKLVKIYKDHADKAAMLDQQIALEVIEHGMKAISIFKEVQQLYQGDQSYQNLGGHTGEIETCIVLLDTLSLLECFHKHSKNFHQYLVDKEFQTNLTTFIKPPKANFLKSLGESVFNTLDALERELYLMKKNIIPEQKRALALLHRGSNIRYRVALTNYFSEDKDVMPSELNASEQSEYRRRRVQTECGRSFIRIINLQFQEDGDELLQLALKYMQENIHSSQYNNQDMVVALSAALAMNCSNYIRSSLPHNVEFEETLKWSRQLFDKRSQDNRLCHEACMLLLLFHWPTQSKVKHSLCPQSLLKEALENLHSIFSQHRRQDRILYYLSNGSGFDSIVHAKDVRGDKQGNVKQRIETSRLLWLQGTLTNNGHEITTALENSEGVKGLTVTLPTEKPVPDTKMWNKPIFFVLGFCLSGPKAVEVTSTDPRSTADVKFTRPNYPRRKPVTADPVSNNEVFQNEMCRFKEKLQKIKETEMKHRQGIRLSQKEKKLLSTKPQVEEHFRILQEQRYRFLQGYY